MAKFAEGILCTAGRVALAGLVAIYGQAQVKGDLALNPNWTISNVMVYPYNTRVTNLVLFPSFLVLCLAYAVKLPALRIQTGSTVAVVGGCGLMAHPVTTDPGMHVFFALVVFLSSYFWYPECNLRQFRTFGVSSVLFVGGFALDELNKSADLGFSGLLQFLPSIMCMIGEMGIFTTWGKMVQNPVGRTSKGSRWDAPDKES